MIALPRALPTSQSTASAGLPSMWDSHGHAHTSGPHGGVCERDEW
jgi:hypothetical protein